MQLKKKMRILFYVIKRLRRVFSRELFRFFVAVGLAECSAG